MYEHDVDKQEIVRPETWNENEMLYDVVDMELSLTYDILYTKAVKVHTWGGYAICFTSHFVTSAMFLLFWSQSREGPQQPDVLITYIVLGGTVILISNGFSEQWPRHGPIPSWMIGHAPGFTIPFCAEGNGA